MDKEMIRDYLQLAEMSEKQAEALSRILDQMATRDDLLRLEERLLAFEERLDVRSRAFEEKMEARFKAFEEATKGRFHTAEEKSARHLAHLKADLTWRMIAIVGFFGTVITILNAFIG